ncbi:hypothetical protein JTE90_020930 [Oedothorax gibbosus]|uniref:PX domain-containing protein n=1 Tax=Oedothorax gibbosus TaxID=931172 RepID=A0AAV6VQJ1_9ARAC|nr:hypothetical protein JTE90_020930 [Oedothorax gibbosus]
MEKYQYFESKLTILSLVLILILLLNICKCISFECRNLVKSPSSAMTTPSVTLKSLQNEDTGIDISVPRFKEEEAPLGGISILYEISVLTRLDLFKTRLHKSGDVVHFTLFKAYREIEDLYNKLNKKYPKAGLPPVPKTSSAGKYTDEEKVEALDHFMGAIAKNVEVLYSSTFTQFIGINSQRMPSFTVPNEVTDTNNSTTDENDKDEIKATFPKMKSSVAIKNLPVIKSGDLFDEVKSSRNESLNVKKISQGLFDDFEDDSLFCTKPVEKHPSSPKEEKKVETPVESKKQSPKKKEKESFAIDVDDSQIIIKDRKQGEVSLFTEQDLGDYITKEEEELFLVTSPNSKTPKNNLLFSENEILSPESDKNLNDNLEDLLDLAPLPNTPVLRKTSLPPKEESKPEITKPDPEITKPVSESTKPVPLPRRRSLGKTETDSKQKPEVKPRKVFLNKTDEPTPQTTRPPVPAKPTAITPTAPQTKPIPPTKPKPPPKKPKPNSDNKSTTDLDVANANNLQPSTENVANLAGDLQDLDILKYIENEEKAIDAQLNLFE